MTTNLSKSFTRLNKLLNRIGERHTHCKVCSLIPELATSFNDQINLEFFASFTYLSMAAFFGRQGISLPGCQKYFMNQALEEREHAQKLIDYLNQRGNNVIMKDIKAPLNQAWESPLSAFKEALELEKSVSKKLFQLHKISEEYGDICACNLLENDYLDTQVEECDKLSRHIAQLERIGSDGLGIYLFDKYLLKENKE